MRTELKLADIVALQARGFQKPLTYLTTPYTDKFHFLLLGQYVSEDDDWVIYEALISKGMRVGRLSWYGGQNAQIFRATNESFGELIVHEATIYGRSDYDHLLIFKLIGDAVGFWWKYGPRKVPYYVLRDRPNSGLLCTEVITKSYEKYWRLVAEGIAASPSAIINAYYSGLIREVYNGDIPEAPSMKFWSA